MQIYVLSAFYGSNSDVKRQIPFYPLVNQIHSAWQLWLQPYQGSDRHVRRGHLTSESVPGAFRLQAPLTVLHLIFLHLQVTESFPNT